MKPNDKNAALPTDERPFRVLIISWSQRRQYNCPWVDSKSRMLMLKMAAMLPQEREIDFEDLWNVYGRKQIKSCNACVSTSMALCVRPCNCYSKNSLMEPDLMRDLDLYARLDMADARAIIWPINRYGPTSNLKLMFDSLVRMNGGNPDESTIKHKDPELAMKFEHTEQRKEMSLNHLEWRTAAFFCYGDKWGDEMAKDGTPKILEHKNYFDPSAEPYENERDAYAPFVRQCRYGGIEVPDHLRKAAISGRWKKYSENQSEDMVKEDNVMKSFRIWVQEFAQFVEQKWKVKPWKYRAYGFKPKTNLWHEFKTGLRERKMRLGKPPVWSSPDIQEKLWLNEDITIVPKKGEGKKLRK